EAIMCSRQRCGRSSCVVVQCQNQRQPTAGGLATLEYMLHTTHNRGDRMGRVQSTNNFIRVIGSLHGKHWCTTLCRRCMNLVCFLFLDVVEFLVEPINRTIPGDAYYPGL